MLKKIIQPIQKPLTRYHRSVFLWSFLEVGNRAHPFSNQSLELSCGTWP